MKRFPIVYRKILIVLSPLLAVASLVCTTLLLGNRYGFAELPRAGSAIAIFIATILLGVFSTFLAFQIGLSYGPVHKILNWITLRADLQLARLSPLVFFLGVFILSGSGLHPFEEFVRSITLPFTIHLFVLLILWTIWLVYQLTQESAPASAETISISRASVRRKSWLLFITLVEANILASFLAYIDYASAPVQSLLFKFMVEIEASFYTYASALYLLLIAIVLTYLVRSATKTGMKILWSLLAFLFLLFSLDEVVSIHEQVIGTLRLVGNDISSSVYAYLVPLALFIFVGLFILIRVFQNDKVRKWGLFFLGMLMLLGGAVFVEAITEGLEWQMGDGNVPYVLAKSLLLLEEGLELSGTLILFFFGLEQLFDSDGKVEFRKIT